MTDEELNEQDMLEEARLMTKPEEEETAIVSYAQMKQWQRLGWADYS